MRSKWTLAVVVGLAAVVAYAANVHATPPVGFTPAQQWKGVFGELDIRVVSKQPRHKVRIKTKGLSDVYVTRNTIDPGGQSGWHTHPGPSLIIVAAGEITAYEGDDRHCTPTKYTAGQGFVDPGDGHVHLLRNETNEPAETVAVQFLPTGATRRIDAPDPGNCGF
jgi:quercetin dioxygenase-like cupin family protein